MTSTPRQIALFELAEQVKRTPQRWGFAAVKPLTELATHVLANKSAYEAIWEHGSEVLECSARIIAHANHAQQGLKHLNSDKFRVRLRDGAMCEVSIRMLSAEEANQQPRST